MAEEFYNDSELFLTGGSGTVGKAVIEKLLRSCSVKRIYVLIRSKKGKSAQERLQDIKNSSIFDVLKQVKPNELDKLVAVQGEVQLPGLGLSEESKDLLKNVNYIFHSAATVRFDEPIRNAILLNVKGTLEALQFAESLKHLKLFMHFSTFYSNCYVQYIENKLYPAKADYKMCLKLAESDIPDNLLDPITEKFVGDFPNTYTFTKHLTEYVVNDFRDRLPVAIYRFSIVVPAIREPAPGYTDSFYGVVGLFLGIGSGLLRTLYADPTTQLDKAPLDCVVKVLLLQTMRAAQMTEEKRSKDVLIYTYSATRYFRRIYKGLQDEIDNIKHRWELFATYPSEKMFWTPHCVYTPCIYQYKLRLFFLQLLPCLLLDGILKLRGSKPMAMDIQRRLYIANVSLRHFLWNTFDSEGITDVDELADMTRGTAFEFATDALYDVKDENHIKESFMSLQLSCRKFLLKEDDSSIPRSRKVYKALKYLDYAVRYGLYFWIAKTGAKCVYNYIEKHYS